MNCQQFTTLIVETARGGMLEAAARDGALRHTESCAECAARFTQEKSLTDALRTVALSGREASAPARVEAKLLAAFQQNLSGSNAVTLPAAASLLPTIVPARRAQASVFSLRRAAPAWMPAIAASLVLVALAALYIFFAPTSPRVEITGGAPPAFKDSPPDKATVTPSSTPAVKSDAGGREGGTTEKVATEGRQIERETMNRKGRVEPERAAAKLARATHVPRMLRSQQVIDGGSAIIEASASESDLNSAGDALRAGEAESVTEFISLVAGAPAATPLESGQLVRVKLPRSALASLGLPLNAERDNEPVKADVLLGNDGLARAIRFVR